METHSSDPSSSPEPQSRSSPTTGARASSAASAAASPTALFSPAFVALLLVQFTYGLAFTTYFALPKFLIEVLNAPATLVGSAHGAFALAGALAVLVVGAVADRYGRKPVMIAGLLLGCLSFPLMGYLTTPAWILATRVLHGLSFSMVFASGGALAIDLAPPARRAEAVGYFGSAMLVTDALGPVLGEWIAEQWGWKQVFLLCSVYCGMGLLVSIRLHAPLLSRQRGGAWTVPFSVPLAGAYLASLALGLGVGTSKTFIPATLVVEAGQRIAPYFVCYTGGALLQRLAFGKVPDRLGHLRATTLSLTLYAIAMLSAAALPAPWLLLAAPVIGIAHGMAYPASAALSVDLCRSEQRGRVTALCTGFFNVGFGTSATALAPFEPALGYRGLIAAGSILLLACAWAIVRLVNTAPSKPPYRPQHRQPTEPASLLAKDAK